MKVLLLGSGGREHALAWKIAQSPKVEKLYIAPGNAGTSEAGENVNLKATDFPALKAFALEKEIDMIVVGPEDPLVQGIFDSFKEDPATCHIDIIGPTAKGATLEGSKEFAKGFMMRHNIPTARYKSITADNLQEGLDFLASLEAPYVLKADGLCAGKGVLILPTLEEAQKELKEMLDGMFGDASATVVIEEFLSGIECSVFVATDGKNYKILPVAKDYKRIGEGDTGPNTGGKTVSLKTLGLLCLMTQCGLHIPCDDRSAVSIFSSVLADIGDEQSIEQSLSTFSAHMKNIVQILDEADEHCLILFDELGAGTDPVEGAALAIAVIEQARSQGAKIAATTHYAELKTFAMTTAGVENASCEFDVETLCPTYKLLIGIPGKSNAFAISKRLGLSEAVIEKAKAQMDSESIHFEDVLTQLEQKRQQLEKEKAEVDRLYAQREEDARKAREFRTQMERAKENARSRGEAEAKRLLAEAKSVADDTFRELDALRKQQKKLDAQQMNAQRAEIMHNIKQARDAAGVRDESAEPIPKPSRPIEVGDLVEIPGTRRQAEVTAVKDGTLTLKAGVLQMKVKADEVRLIEAAERAATAKKQPQFAPSQRILRTASAARELDIRGMETLEAESVLDNYIDAAVMAHLETVTIIHGKGTGALRKAVHASLRRNKAVKSFRLGNYGEGESGVTVVELK